MSSIEGCLSYIYVLLTIMMRQCWWWWYWQSGRISGLTGYYWYYAAMRMKQCDANVIYWVIPSTRMEERGNKIYTERCKNKRVWTCLCCIAICQIQKSQGIISDGWDQEYRPKNLIPGKRDKKLELDIKQWKYFLTATCLPEALR